MSKEVTLKDIEVSICIGELSNDYQFLLMTVVNVLTGKDYNNLQDLFDYFREYLNDKEKNVFSNVLRVLIYYKKIEKKADPSLTDFINFVKDKEKQRKLNEYFDKILEDIMKKGV